MQKRCDDHNKYCGGTWAGTTKMLGYIQQMGFDAMWMSPFTQQGPDNMDSQAYHGENRLEECGWFLGGAGRAGGPKTGCVVTAGGDGWPLVVVSCWLMSSSSWLGGAAAAMFVCAELN